MVWDFGSFVWIRECKEIWQTQTYKRNLNTSVAAETTVIREDKQWKDVYEINFNAESMTWK